ncbi:MAG: threonine synthase [Elusimicrobia bacterium CG08_land_8_20_14_0_20_59_10]|nr:MAG: threonine synthase [Elusimicrobia bacterium CG08_land_8_20_14_0_20_59_10]
MSTQFHSTNYRAPKTDFFTAVLTGQAPDRGLYMPESIPRLDKAELQRFSGAPYHEAANFVLRAYLDGISDEDLLAKCKKAYSFMPRLEKAGGNKHILWLDTGPTASFKDFAAQMMSPLMGHKLGRGEKLVILTATSGDTGSAIANAFHNIPNIEIIILFPIAEVTSNQRKQMTTLGGNVKTIAVSGKFDDCQAMVKEAFADERLKGLKLSSANSINIARLIPQSVYFIWAYAQLAKAAGEEVIFSIPSGNFGDMMGAILAWKMGLPVKKLIVATNANDEFPAFLKTGTYNKIEPSRMCISNAMNVGHPSNLTRLVDVFGGRMDEKGNLLKAPDMEKMRGLIHAVSVSDEETRKCIADTYKEEAIVLEPHGAVAWYALGEFLREHEEDAQTLCISLETANPAKFPEEINRILGISPVVPESLSKLDKLKEDYLKMDADYAGFYSYLSKI